MKIREGFVSNSSSSSFIIVGFVPNKAQIEKMQELDEVGYKGGALYYQEDYNLLGYYWSVSEGDTGAVKPQQITEAEKKLKDLFGDKINAQVHFGADFNG